jgi:NTP pyrophosphatase (non-canonical NTP hydrolase)
MTIADHIREETMSKYARNLAKEGFDASFIAKMTELSVKKVQDIIQKIKDSSN